MDFTTDPLTPIHYLSRALVLGLSVGSDRGHAIDRRHCSATNVDPDIGSGDGFGDDDALGVSVIAYTSSLRAAVPSYLGFQMVIVENGHPVTLTVFEVDETARTSLRLPLHAFGQTFDPDSRLLLYAATPGAFVDLAADLSYALRLSTDRPGRLADLNASEGDHRCGGDRQSEQRDIRQEHRSSATADHYDCQPELRQEEAMTGDQTAHEAGGDQRVSDRIVLDADLPPTGVTSGLSVISEFCIINRAVGVLIDQGHDPGLAGAILQRRATALNLESHVYAARLLDQLAASDGSHEC